MRDWEFDFRVCFGIDFRNGEDKCGLEDNVYTVCDSEVVSTGCYHAALVSFTSHRFMGSFSAIAT